MSKRRRQPTGRRRLPEVTAGPEARFLAALLEQACSDARSADLELAAEARAWLRGPGLRWWAWTDLPTERLVEYLRYLPAMPAG